MLRLRRILFPTDFSACAEDAFTHAAYLAQRTGAELHVLHVVEGTMASPGDWVQDFRITLEDIAADLDVPFPAPPDEEQAPQGFVPLIDAEVEAESAGPAILHYAEDHAIDLIVMGTHGRRGFRRLLMGSVAEEVVRLAPCPVFTVGGQEASDGSWAIRRIVAPVDFSDHARLAARHAAALAEAYAADLDLLHVIEAAALPTATAPFVAAFTVSADEAQLILQEALERYTAELEAEFPAIGEVGAFVRVGRPASDIVDFAEAHDADLLVLGSHGRSGMERLLMGSVAEQVIRTAPCPVFTVKSFGQPLLAPIAERDRPETKPNAQSTAAPLATEV